MKPYHALLGILLAMSGFSCNKKIDAKTGEDGKGADRVVPSREKSKIKLSSTDYDFGIMEVGQVGRHTFTITSVGDEPLDVKQGKTTCKCTVGGMTKGGKKLGKDDTLTLKKGETASIELEWTPTAMSADIFSQSATIHTSDPDKPQIQLAIHGQVQEIMSLQPPEVWPVGTIDGQTAGKFEGVLGSAILKDFKITKITAAEKSISHSSKPLTPAELKTHRFKSGYKITVVILPKDDIGRFEEKLVIKTDARKALVFSPKIVGVRTGPMLIRPDGRIGWSSDSMRLSLGRFPASKGRSANLLLYVAGLGNDELKITKVEKDADVLSIGLQKVVDPEEKPDAKAAADPGRRKQYRLTFAVPPGKEPSVRDGSQAVKVTLHMNHKRMKSIALTVSFNSY